MIGFILIFIFIIIMIWGAFFKKNPNYDKAIRESEIKRHNSKIIFSANENKKELINNSTHSEKLLLKKLNKDKSLKNKFKFQEIIFIFNEKENKLIDKYYIADFYFPTEKLIIELDGGYHSTKNQTYKDEHRTKEIFLNRGIKTIRFNNEEVYNTDIIKSIKKNLKKEYENKI